MRDPDLVKRAERAAMSLERAWSQWRAAHGVTTAPMAPVSSYVGYSLEEPWGQPRVVFGVGAEDAEKLAALLDGHDCVGPVHAELTSPARLAARADRRSGEVNLTGASQRGRGQAGRRVGGARRRPAPDGHRAGSAVAAIRGAPAAAEAGWPGT